VPADGATLTCGARCCRYGQHAEMEVVMTGRASVKIVEDQLVLGPVTVDFQRTRRIGDGVASAATGSGSVSVAAGRGLPRHATLDLWYEAGVPTGESGLHTGRQQPLPGVSCRSNGGFPRTVPRQPTSKRRGGLAILPIRIRQSRSD
jgi:hypothetical protein